MFDGGNQSVGEYDLGGDFSSSSNPNGHWRYGHTESTGLSMASFALDAFSIGVGPIRFWHPSDAELLSLRRRQ